MNHEDPEPQKLMPAMAHLLDNDRFDGDRIETYGESAPVPDEYKARIERQRKHAAIRTEMIERARNSNYSGHRPDGTF